MKLSKREKYLIIFLVMLIICYVIYTLASKSATTTMAALRSEHETISQEYTKSLEAIKKKAENELKYKTLNYQLINMSEGYLHNIEQEKVMIFLENYFTKNHIKVTSISYSQVEQNNKKVSQEQLAGTEASAEDTSTEENNDISQLCTMNIGLAFDASYYDFLSFIDDIEKNDIKMTISSLNFIVAAENKISATMTLSMFSLDFDIINTYQELKWIDKVTFGKYNPFLYKIDMGTVNKKDEKKYDFVMSVRPTSSDLPTLAFGKTDSDNSDAYVYDDANAVSDININLKLENNKYYYQYYTQKASYPSKDEWKEFIPNNKNNIDMIIYSCDKNSIEDAAGVNIIISNKTKLTINCYVKDDDKDKPRVVFQNTKGIVIKK